MKRSDKYRLITTAVMALGLVGLGGCIEYTVETTLNADGSGSRHEEMKVAVSEDAEFKVTPETFTYLMHVGAEDGWSHTLEENGDDADHLFSRERVIRDVSSWSELNGDIRISGPTPATAGARVRYVTLGDVQFRNAIRVETGQAADGGRSFTYRETFYFDNVWDATIENALLTFENELQRVYPRLGAAETAELVGLLKGGIWSMLDQGLFEGDLDDDSLTAASIDRTTQVAMHIVRRRYPNADADEFAAILRMLYDDDDPSDAFLKEYLPGAQLASQTEIHFRLNMPGRVTGTNADERDGETLVWKFGPWAAAAKPVEIYAECVVEN